MNVYQEACRGGVMGVSWEFHERIGGHAVGSLVGSVVGVLRGHRGAGQRRWKVRRLRLAWVKMWRDRDDTMNPVERAAITVPSRTPSI